MKPYRVLVTGSRTWDDWRLLKDALDAELSMSRADGRPMVVVQGGAAGADIMAIRWATLSWVRCETHHADWRPNGVYNPQAGLARNRKMVELGADMVLAFIRNGSRGATHCADLAEAAGIEVRRYTA